MTQKQVLRKIIDLISNEMISLGFETSYKEQGFIKKTSDAIFIYQLLIYDRTNIQTGQKGFLIEPYIWLGLREIEKYYKEITLNTELKRDIDFITIGNSIASLLANPGGIYKVRNQSLDLFVFEEQNIIYVARQVLQKFKEVALPYILNNANLNSIDLIINSNPDEYKVHTRNDNYRIIKGLIAAKLNKNPNFKELIGIYDKQIEERDMYNIRNEISRLKSILPLIGERFSI